ncbi:MAG: discoidin domain-containing protein [Spirochaetes bacterium]|nr:discoidin domain-containing protein [Spirochaetota bacterium]
MNYIDISKKKIHAGTVIASSGDADPSVSAKNLVTSSGIWCTKKHNSMSTDYAIVDYGEIVPVNFIEILPSANINSFPESFRVEGSIDGNAWSTIHYERLYEASYDEIFRLDIPLTFIRYLKLLILRHRNLNKKFFSEISAISTGIAGFKSLTASSSSSHQHDVSKLIDGIAHTFWESEQHAESVSEKINIDLGNIFHINRISLSAANIEDHCFPEDFVVEVSTDLDIWKTVVTEKGFIAEAGCTYFWEIAAAPARYIRLEMDRKIKSERKLPLRLAAIEVAAAHVNPYHTHNIGEITPYASVFSAGIVRLAHDGEDAMGTAVQGSDHRLRDASVIFKGIVRLANHGETADGLALQASDPRIQPATEVREGIVRLAYDRECKAGAVVQSNDSRLQEATTQSFGIVRLCPDGVYSDNAVVVGNDSRLQKATTTSYGICRLAENGENSPECVVQGNDKRLRDATTLYKGIVELAEDGEDREGVVVQGNDRRLKMATVETPGIVRLAKSGEKREGVAVQANDERLFDAREPLPHTHEYAPLKHEYNSHTGTIAIISEKHTSFSGILPPPESAAIVYARNESKSPGAVGVLGVASSHFDEKMIHQYGVLGHANFIGIRGQSSGYEEGANRGCGVLGISRFGAGGVFVSEHSFSLVADGFGAIDEFDTSCYLKGNGDALLVRGKSEFHGSIHLFGNGNLLANIVEFFEVEDSEYIAEGDLLVASPKGKGILARSRTPYDSGVIGIVSSNPCVVLNNVTGSAKKYPVVLSGRTMMRVDARKRKVKPGDLIVTSDTPGCGMATDKRGDEIVGAVIAKALDFLDEGIGLIQVFVVHF